jgi:hypothetical protein
MKQRKFTNGITFFTTQEMFQTLKGISDEKELGLSEVLRNIIEEYCESNLLKNTIDDSSD